MKKILYTILGLSLFFPLVTEAVYLPVQGGTGISNIPTYGKVLVGNSGGTYTLTSTSSLGITGSGGSSASSTLLGDTNTFSTTGTTTFTNGISAKYLALTGTTASSTGANGINLTAGCFAISGTCVSSSGGATSPAGSDTQIQFNNSGSFGASSNFTWTGTFLNASVNHVTLGETGANSTYVDIDDTSNVRQILLSANGGLFSWNNTLDSATNGNMIAIGTFTSATTTATSTFAGFLKALRVTASNFIATSTTASTLPYASSTALTVTDALYVPISSNPTLSTTGQFSLNSASSTIKANFSGTSLSFYNTQVSSTIYASSSLAYDGAYGTTGTTTYILGNYPRSVTLKTLYCKVTAGSGTAYVTIGTGTATSTVNCSTTGVESTTNVTFQQRNNYMISIGDITGTPGLLTVTEEIQGN